MDFLRLVGGLLQRVTAISSSSGAADADKLIASGTDGYLDSSVIPFALGHGLRVVGPWTNGGRPGQIQVQAGPSDSVIGWGLLNSAGGFVGGCWSSFSSMNYECGTGRHRFIRSDSLLAEMTQSSLSCAVPLRLPVYVLATVPSAATLSGALIFVSNASEGATIAFSDGMDWRRIRDNAIIS